MTPTSDILDFCYFLLKKTYNPLPIKEDYIHYAFSACCTDVCYHFPDKSNEDIFNCITRNKNELPIFLYRLGRILHTNGSSNISIDAINWLLRECCACEIYFNNNIGVGFYIVHGVGTIIGSRNIIGEGFKIYQGCTVGHKAAGGKGNVIGNNVTLYSNSQILGENNIGNNVIIGANSLVLSDIPSNSVCIGSPAKYTEREAT